MSVRTYAPSPNHGDENADANELCSAMASMALAKPHQGGSSADDDRRALLVKEMIDTVTRATDLLFGVDKDIENLPNKRVRKPARRDPVSGTESLKVRNNTDPDTVSLGYGELTANGFGKVLAKLIHGVPEHLRLGPDSTFIDIGSGFGKIVLQTPLWVPDIRRAVGIEYGQMRHDKANEVMQQLCKRDTAWKERLASVELIRGDATDFDYTGFSHIFTYDYIFSEATHRALLPRIAEADFKTFACFCNERKLRNRGFTEEVKLTLLDKFPVGNTGKENHTVFIYAKA